MPDSGVVVEAFSPIPGMPKPAKLTKKFTQLLPSDLVDEAQKFGHADRIGQLSCLITTGGEGISSLYNAYMIYSHTPC